MGYRSDLALALHPQAVPHFEDACREVAAAPGASFTTPFHEDSAKRRDEEDGVLLVWESTKCYDWSSILKAFRRRLREAGFDKSDELFFSLRIGENEDDNQEEGCWYDNPFAICLERSLSYDGA